MASFGLVWFGLVWFGLVWFHYSKPRKTYSELHCKLLLALVIVLVANLSPEIAITILCLC